MEKHELGHSSGGLVRCGGFFCRKFTATAYGFLI